jgi:anti-sigma factor RsiW
MKCLNENQVTDLVVGRLAKTEAESCLTHAESCERCAAKIDQALDMDALIRSAFHDDMQSIENYQPAIQWIENHNHPRFNLQTFVAIAASIALLCTIAVLQFGKFSTETSRSEVNERIRATIVPDKTRLFDDRETIVVPVPVDSTEFTVFMVYPTVPQKDDDEAQLTPIQPSLFAGTN